MSNIRLTNRYGYRIARGSVGFSPIFAMILASQPGVAVAATPAPSSVVSVCSGVSLPPSVVTGIISPVLTNSIGPLQTSVNGLLSGVIGGGTTFNLTQLLSNAASGSPITLDAISNSGGVISPGSSCYSQASGFTLATPAGIAIGGNQITGLGNSGSTASAGELNSIAFGNGATTATTATGAIALGTNSAVDTSAVGGVALGNGASVSAANSVAIGANSAASRGALNSYTGYALSAPQTSAGEVSVGAAGAERQLTNVAAGSAATDAVNVAQLTAVNGQVTTNTAAIASQGAQIATNTTAIGTLNGLAVEYNDAGHGAITLGGTGAAPVALGNIQAGALSATSTAAVNGSQLFTTNANVATNTAGLSALGTTVTGQGTTIASQGAQLTTDTTAIGTLNGLAVEYNDTGHGAITLGGTGSAPVALGNIQAGALSATSTAAVNGSQLFATNANVTANTAGLGSLGTTVAGQGTTIAAQGTQLATDTSAIGTLNSLAVEYNDTGHSTVTLGGAGSAPVSLGNIQAGTLSATSTDAVNGGQLFATNANVAANATGLSSLGTTVTGLGTTIASQGTQLNTDTNAIVTLRLQTADGAIGPVQYSTPQTPTVPNGGTPTDDVALVGRDSNAVALHNVANGVVATGSTDAVNGGQLFALGNQIGTISGLAVEYDDASKSSVTLGNGTNTVLLHNVQAGTLGAASTDAVNGSQLFATNTGVAANAAGLSSLDTTVAGQGTTIAAQGTQIATDTSAIGTLNSLAVVYSDSGHSAITLGGAGSAPVALGNVQAGTLSATSTDAVNGSQLFATNANVAVDTAGLSSLGATVTAQGTTLASQGAQLNTDTNAIGTLGSLAVEYNDSGHGAITLGGAGSAPVALGNVQAGTLSATSTDAVNGSQLFTTNANVATNASNIATLSTTVGNQATTIAQEGADITANADATAALRSDTQNGAIGPVQYSFVATPTTPNGGTPTNSLTLVGAANAPVALHNVADGAISVTSTDAVNGSQLFALSSSVGSLSGLSVQYDDASRTRVTLSNSAGTPVALDGLAAATLSASSTDAVNGSQLYTTNQTVAGLATDVGAQSTQIASLNTQVGENSTDIGLTSTALSNLATQIGDGAVGPVQYSSTAQPTVPDGVPSQDLTLVGANPGAVGLHNVAAGSLSGTSTDAVNGAQLYATNQSISTLANDVGNQASTISSLSTAVSTNTTDINQTNTQLNQLGTSVANGGIGPVQYSSASNPTMPDGGVPSQDLTLIGASGGPVALHNLAAGNLAAGSTDAVNGSQLGALGTATASVFGTTYTYNPATNSYSGSFNYGGSNYSSIQAVLGAIQTSVATGDIAADDTGIKYFHTTSSMADSSATGGDSTAIGPEAVSSGDASIAVGRGAIASGTSSVAIGNGASAQNGEAVSIGVGNLASGNGAVSIGDPNDATGDGATALGKDNSASGDGAIALGDSNNATGQGAAAIGNANTSNGIGAAAIGYENSATGDGAIAIGSSNVATGADSLAIGTNVQTTATDTLAIGSNAVSSGASSVTVGNRTLASGSTAVAVGNDAKATGNSSSAFGNQASATGQSALAEGAMSSATTFASTAIGTGASVTGNASTAIGTGSIASYDGSVALGSASQTVRGAVADYSAFGLSGSQSSAGEIAVARNIPYTDPTTGLPTLTGNRQITGVAAGMTDTDAVNVAQLRGASAGIGTVVAVALGGGSSYNPTTGQLTAPSYTLGSVTYGSVGDALEALAANESSASSGNGSTGSSGSAGSGGTTVTYADAGHTTVQLAPTGTTIQNVAPGALTPTSTDAVNGSQLTATNSAVASDSQAISTLATQVSTGAIGVVRYSSSSAPTTANGGTQTNDATLVGQNANAPVALHNVAAGNVAVGSTDAVNGAQLAATNALVGTAQTTANTALALGSNSVQYDSTAESSVTLGNSDSGAVTVHNVAPGITATDAANMGQVNAAMASAVSQADNYTDGRIAALSFDLRNVQRDASAGAAGAMAMAGMPQPYEAGKGMIAMGAGTFQGQTAIALGAAAALKDGHTVLKIGATYNSRGMVGANAGVGWQF